MSSLAIDRSTPILLFNDECGVCRRISAWVQRSAKTSLGKATIVDLPIGDDPEALRKISPNLSIWDAYATIHLLMPDGSMKLGGEAVAEVLRRIPKVRWFAWTFRVSWFGFKPFQRILNLCYAILAGVRPLFGCESCGPSSWMKPIHRFARWVRGTKSAGAPTKTPLLRASK